MSQSNFVSNHLLSMGGPPNVVRFTAPVSLSLDDIVLVLREEQILSSSNEIDHGDVIDLEQHIDVESLPDECVSEIYSYYELLDENKKQNVTDDIIVCELFSVYLDKQRGTYIKDFGYRAHILHRSDQLYLRSQNTSRRLIDTFNKLESIGWKPFFETKSN